MKRKLVASHPWRRTTRPSTLVSSSSLPSRSTGRATSTEITTFLLAFAREREREGKGKKKSSEPNIPISTTNGINDNVITVKSCAEYTERTISKSEITFHRFPRKTCIRHYFARNITFPRILRFILPPLPNETYFSIRLRDNSKTNYGIIGIIREGMTRSIARGRRMCTVESSAELFAEKAKAKTRYDGAAERKIVPLLATHRPFLAAISHISFLRIWANGFLQTNSSVLSLPFSPCPPTFHSLANLRSIHSRNRIVRR